MDSSTYRESASKKLQKFSRTSQNAPPPSPRGPLIASGVTRDGLKLSWQPVFTGDLASSYVVEKRDVTDGHAGSWLRVGEVKGYANSCEIADLTEGRFYVFRVSARNKAGASSPLESREPVLIKSPYSIPGPPASVRLVGLTRDSMTVEWTAPVSDGGSHVTGYVVEKKDSRSGHWTRVDRVPPGRTACRLDGLLSGSSYYVRVAAENSEGLGYYREFAEPVKPGVPKDLPGAPSNLQVYSTTKDSIGLRWDAPIATGGVPLSGFQVEQQEACVGGSGVTSKWRTVAKLDPCTTRFTARGLAQGLEYNFRVRAENPFGLGAACGLSSPVVPASILTRPLAPAMLEVTGVTEDSVTLSWLPPERDGGSRILRYLVEQRESGGQGAWFGVKSVDADDNLVASMVGLIEGTPYVFRVSAENEVGLGTPAQLREAVVPRKLHGLPGKPTGPLRVIRVTRSMLALHWAPPYDGSAYQVERYVIEKTEGDDDQWRQAGVCSSEVTAYCVTDLLENQPYRFRVKAETSSGFSEPLEMEGAVVPRRVFESVPMDNIELHLRESELEYSEVSVPSAPPLYGSRLLAYSDEPLTLTQDYVSLSNW